jgi:hypothetical protein
MWDVEYIYIYIHILHSILYSYLWLQVSWSFSPPCSPPYFTFSQRRRVAHWPVIALEASHTQTCWSRSDSG